MAELDKVGSCISTALSISSDLLAMIELFLLMLDSLAPRVMKFGMDMGLADPKVNLNI